MFENFLKEKHAQNFMGTDDNMPDNFEYWLSNLDVQELVDFGEEAIAKYSAKFLGSIKSDKKAISSRANGSKGGRPKLLTPHP